MTAHLIHYFLPIHYLYICSIILYLFLLTGYLFLSSYLSSLLLKVALCLLIFLPMNQYYVLILLGHPYSAQFFLVILLLLVLIRIRHRVEKTEILEFKSFYILLGWMLVAVTLYSLGIWVSEFSAIFLLIPVYYLIFDKTILNYLRRNFKSPWFFNLVFFPIALMIWYYNLRAEIKHHYWDQGYDSYFLTSYADVQKNIMYFLLKLKTSLLFQDVFAIENVFNMYIVLLTIFVIIARLRKPDSLSRKDWNLVNATLLVCAVSVLVMFFSYWNLLSEFCPRYYTPVYIAYCFILLFLLNKYLQKKYLRILVVLGFVYTTFGYTYNTIIRHHESGPFVRYGKFRDLPPGTLIASYWETHKINAVAIDNLQSLPYDHELIRMNNWKDEVLKSNDFYF